MTYNVIKGNVPITLLQQHQLYVSKTNTCTGARFLLVSGPTLLNNLPSHVRNAQSLRSFKKHLFQYLHRDQFSMLLNFINLHFLCSFTYYYLFKYFQVNVLDYICSLNHDMDKHLKFFVCYFMFLQCLFLSLVISLYILKCQSFTLIFVFLSCKTLSLVLHLEQYVSMYSTFRYSLTR